MDTIDTLIDKLNNDNPSNTDIESCFKLMSIATKEIQNKENLSKLCNMIVKIHSKYKKTDRTILSTLWKYYIPLLKCNYSNFDTNITNFILDVLITHLTSGLNIFLKNPTFDRLQLLLFFASRLSASLYFLLDFMSNNLSLEAFTLLKCLYGSLELKHINYALNLNVDNCAIEKEKDRCLDLIRKIFRDIPSPSLSSSSQIPSSIMMTTSPVKNSQHSLQQHLQHRHRLRYSDESSFWCSVDGHRADELSQTLSGSIGACACAGGMLLAIKDLENIGEMTELSKNLVTEVLNHCACAVDRYSYIHAFGGENIRELQNPVDDAFVEGVMIKIASMPNIQNIIGDIIEIAIDQGSVSVLANTIIGIILSTQNPLNQTKVSQLVSSVITFIINNNGKGLSHQYLESLSGLSRTMLLYCPDSSAKEYLDTLREHCLSCLSMKENENEVLDAVISNLPLVSLIDRNREFYLIVRGLVAGAASTISQTMLSNALRNDQKEIRTMEWRLNISTAMAVFRSMGRDKSTNSTSHCDDNTIEQVTKLCSHMKSKGSTNINSVIVLLCEQVEAIMIMFEQVNISNAITTNYGVLHQFSTILPALLSFADCYDAWGTGESLSTLCFAISKVCSTTIYIANKSRSVSGQNSKSNDNINISINENTDNIEDIKIRSDILKSYLPLSKEESDAAEIATTCAQTLITILPPALLLCSHPPCKEQHLDVIKNSCKSVLEAARTANSWLQWRVVRYLLRSLESAVNKLKETKGIDCNTILSAVVPQELQNRLLNKNTGTSMNCNIAAAFGALSHRLYDENGLIDLQII